MFITHKFKLYLVHERKQNIHTHTKKKLHKLLEVINIA